MLGVVNATLDTMRLKTLYVRGHVSDTTTVLVTLASPSIEEDPWQSFAVKWVENGQPSQLRLDGDRGSHHPQDPGFSRSQ